MLCFKLWRRFSPSTPNFSTTSRAVSSSSGLRAKNTMSRKAIVWVSAMLHSARRVHVAFTGVKLRT